MKKHALFLSAIAMAATSGLFAAAQNGSQKQSSGSNQQMQASPSTDCTKMSAAEQNFANQLNDPSNKVIFCSQFTPQQRQQAMSMMGQMDISGSPMNADGAVQQVMQAPAAPATQPKRSGGGCPVK